MDDYKEALDLAGKGMDATVGQKELERKVAEAEQELERKREEREN